MSADPSHDALAALARARLSRGKPVDTDPANIAFRPTPTQPGSGPAAPSISEPTAPEGRTEASRPPSATGLAGTPLSASQPPSKLDFGHIRPIGPGQDPQLDAQMRGGGGGEQDRYRTDPAAPPQPDPQPTHPSHTATPSQTPATTHAHPSILGSDPDADPFLAPPSIAFPEPPRPAPSPTHETEREIPPIEFQGETHATALAFPPGNHSPGNYDPLTGTGSVAPPVPTFDRYGRSASTYARVWLVSTHAAWAKKTVKEQAKLCGISETRFRAIRGRMGEQIGAFWQGELAEAHAIFNEALVASMAMIGQEGSRDRALFARLTNRLADPRMEELRRQDREASRQQAGLGDPLAAALDRARKARRPQDVVIDAAFEHRPGPKGG